LKTSFATSRTIAAKGIEKTAPQNPKIFPPIKKEMKVKTGERPTNFLVKIGLKTLLSICWIKTKAKRAKIAFLREFKKETKKIKIPEIRGPKIGMISKKPERKLREKA
jgi:hypothetical protein